MAIEISVPRLGWSMEEGTFSSWLKQPGDNVQPGDPLFAVESDKVTMDVEALDTGILYIPPDSPQPGERVVPGQRLGYLLAENESAPPADATVPVSPQAAVEAEPLAHLPKENKPTAAVQAAVAVTPRARRVAGELGVDLNGLEGTGKGGRIRERDVRQVATQRPEPPAISAITGVRRTIAARMMRSKQNTAPVTLVRRVDATNLVQLREKLKGYGAVVPSYTDIAVKLSATALMRHPVMASRLEDDAIVTAEGMHIGIAVDTEQGLLVPVIRDVHKLELAQVARRSRELIEAARNRLLDAKDVEGGVFTISNLGSFGIEAFTPILNYPQTAVLGMGEIRWEAVALGNGLLATRQQLTLSLTFDHRVVDGAPAARFLQTLASLIESPDDGSVGST